jgi:hypothetical protein
MTTKVELGMDLGRGYTVADVMSWCSQGFSDREIARRLGVSQPGLAARLKAMGWKVVVEKRLVRTVPEDYARIGRPKGESTKAGR